MRRVLNSLASRVDPSAHPLLDERTVPKAGGKALLFVVTADRGLCGSFNTNAIKAASTFIVENPSREVALGLVGRRGRDYFARRGFEVRYELVNLFAALKFDDAQAIAEAAIEAFITGQVDSVYLVYNEFTLRDVAARGRRAPAADPRAELEPRPSSRPARQIDYLYEPSAGELFDRLMPRHVEVQVFRALLDRTPRSTPRR